MVVKNPLALFLAPQERIPLKLKKKLKTNDRAIRNSQLWKYIPYLITLPVYNSRSHQLLCACDIRLAYERTDINHLREGSQLF